MSNLTKMSAKSKKRLCKLENKLLKLDNLEVKDVVCSICQSILIEPVTLPCFHDFCQRCFNGSIENNALCCPLCRLRIGSWLRTTAKQNNLVNIELWNFIKSKFSAEINTKLNGGEIHIPEEKPLTRLSAPGEIRSEYEAELHRLRAERLEQEQRHIEKTELLIKKIQEEEREAQKKYLERLKEDELLAKQLVEEECRPVVQNTKQKQKVKATAVRPRLKATRIDGYLAKVETHAATIVNSPLLTDDNTSTDESTPKAVARPTSRTSPEVVPSYGKLIKNYIDKKIKGGTSLWNKENGKNEKKEEPQTSSKEIARTEEKEKPKEVIKSLVVSLPLPSSGVLQLKTNVQDNRNMETGSADSMRQELCFFKPIEKTTSIKANKVVPVRVPGVRAEMDKVPLSRVVAPSRAQYLDSLCQLRNISLAKNLPSAFVITLNILRVSKEKATLCSNSQTCKKAVQNDIRLPKKMGLGKKTVPNNVHYNSVANSETNLRRTRSMGSISKDENETTPKKAKIQRKVNSERKPYLRSDSKKIASVKRLESPISVPINNNKVNLAVKNLSSPLKNCDVKKILEQQLRIEELIEQEKKDLELARQMDAEWNGRRHLRRAPGKRQVTLNYSLRPAKKMKV